MRAPPAAPKPALKPAPKPAPKPAIAGTSSCAGLVFTGRRRPQHSRRRGGYVLVQFCAFVLRATGHLRIPGWRSVAAARARLVNAARIVLGGGRVSRCCHPLLLDTGQ